MLATLKTLAASFLLVVAPFTSASAIEPRQQQPPGRPWVSIDSSNEAHTFTLHVITVNGAASTVDAQPYSLTNTVFTYIASNSATVTSTGSALPPRATDSSGGKGYFIQCMGGSASNVQPFCQPQNGAKYYVDVPYYITWDAKTFASDPNTPVHIQLFHRDTGGPAVNDSSTSTPYLTLGQNNKTPLRKGYYIWKPKAEFLGNNDEARQFTLRLAFNSSTENKISYRTGATISLLPKDQEPQAVPATDGDDNNAGGGGGGVPAAAIAVPIVIVVLLAAAIGAFFLIRKRRRSQAAAGVHNRGSSAFGNRGSAQYKQKPNQDIELTTSPTSPRGQGGNVFQEEIERQNRERAI